MWEYNIIVFSFKMKEELKTELNKYGAENWEVFNYSDDGEKDRYSSRTTARIMFKRKIICQNVLDVEPAVKSTG